MFTNENIYLMKQAWVGESEGGVDNIHLLRPSVPLPSLVIRPYFSYGLIDIVSTSQMFLLFVCLLNFYLFS